MFTGERLPSPVLAPLERGGGRSVESAEDLSVALLNAKFWEPINYRGARGHNSGLFKDIPQDPDTPLPDFDFFRREVDTYLRISLRWIGLHARRKAGRGQIDPLDVATRVQMRYWAFVKTPELPKEPSEDFDPRSKLQIWFEEAPRTYGEFRTRVNDLVSQGVFFERQEIAREGNGVRGHRQALEDYKKDLKKYDEAVAKGWTEYPDGTPVKKPEPPAVSMQPYTRTSQEGEEYEPELSEAHSPGQNTRIETLGAEERLEHNVERLERAFAERLLQEGPLCVLEEKIARNKRDIEAAKEKKDSEAVGIHSERLNNNSAEKTYQTRLAAGEDTSRPKIAEEFEADAEKMDNTWKDANDTFKRRCVTNGVDETLEGLGISTSSIIDSLDGDLGAKRELKNKLKRKNTNGDEQ